ncbi:MAG TPA: NAD(P)-binding protein, partial [Nitrospiria bacterium]|nr:NAD(P)-binding protein [Nitrospiria bacterium]
MEKFDAVIAGGGPAGSTFAWRLQKSGMKTAILDKAVFPRDKVCGGWITPAVLDLL